MASILAIGIATLDIINSVDGYPQEDEEVRALERQCRRGGNAANSAVILAQLGQQCSWAGSVSDDRDGDFILGELQRYGVDTRHSCRSGTGCTPTSYITHNRRNGSRTIVHYRDLTEYSFDHFCNIDLTSYDWLHVEGRQCRETARMLRRARQQQPQLPVSIEIEKPRTDSEVLYEFADLLLFSRDFAQHHGFRNGADFLRSIRTQAARADLVCAWGDQGAWALAKTVHGQASSIEHSPAFPPPLLVDTLAAGDTFNAALIDARCKGLPLTAALTAACQLAGRKCGIDGLDLAGNNII